MLVNLKTTFCLLRISVQQGKGDDSSLPKGHEDAMRELQQDNRFLQVVLVSPQVLQNLIFFSSPPKQLLVTSGCN